MKHFLFLVLILSAGITSLKAQENTYIPDPDASIHQRLEEWKDLKFGLLMHWGTYSQWGIVESWSICPEDLSWASEGRKKGVADNYHDYVQKYEELQKTFNPINFNPEKWARAATDAGMKYVIFTTKHHDGFCMFETHLTDYKITSPNTPFSANPRSNVTKEIFNAFREQKCWVGAYFSKPDWHSDYYWWKQFPPSDRNCNYSISKHPDQWKKFVDFTHAQIDELMSDYGKVDILWLDGGWVRKKSDEDVSKQLLETYEGSRWSRNPQSQDIGIDAIAQQARTKQPGILIVDRDVQGPYQDYLTPEQKIPEEGLSYPWETCMTMGNSWSYVPTDTYKTADTLIKILVDVVSKGGNFLLNIGPGPDGAWSPIAYDRLKEIGAWMKINGEAIYGTRMYKVYKDGDDIRYTQSKDGKVQFVFFFRQPDGTISLPHLKLTKQSKVHLLGSTAAIHFQLTKEGTQISIPSAAAKEGKHVWVLKVE